MHLTSNNNLLKVRNKKTVGVWASWTDICFSPFFFPLSLFSSRGFLKTVQSEQGKPYPPDPTPTSHPLGSVFLSFFHQSSFSSLPVFVCSRGVGDECVLLTKAPTLTICPSLTCHLSVQLEAESLAPPPRYVPHCRPGIRFFVVALFECTCWPQPSGGGPCEVFV